MARRDAIIAEWIRMTSGTSPKKVPWRDFNGLEFHSDKRGAGHSDKWCHFVLRPSFLGRLPYGAPLLRTLGDLPRGAFHVMLENLRRPVSALRHDLPIA